MSTQCARCKRPVRNPVIVAGHGYGPRCAALVGDLLTQQAQPTGKKRPRARRGDERQLVIAEVLP